MLDQTPDRSVFGVERARAHLTFLLYSHARHQILTVLVQILDAAPSLASLYAQPILKVLDAQLQRMDEERLVLVAFDLTKRMAQHAGRNLREAATTYVQYTLDALRDQASIAKRRAAVVTLTDIVAYTACMSELSSSRDDIIDLLVAHLASESSVNERREAVRALGMLGASRPSLSPEDVTEKLIKTWALDAEAISSAASLESGLISTDPEVMRVRMPLYIADWVLSQLISIWRESTLRIHHLAVSIPSNGHLVALRTILMHLCRLPTLWCGFSDTNAAVLARGISSIALYPASLMPSMTTAWMPRASAFTCRLLAKLQK